MEPRSMRRRRRLLALAGAATLSLAATAGVSAALASEVTSEERLSVVRDGTTFFTPQGISAYWGQWVDEFPIRLPDGVNLPAQPTAFFDLSGGEDHLFEAGLAQAVLSRHARCAWLGVALDPHATAVDREAAKFELSRYAEYPGVAAGLDVGAYHRQMSAVAREEGRSPVEFEHDVECAFIGESGETR